MPNPHSIVWGNIWVSMKKELAKEIAAAGYNVIKTVNCRKKLDVKKFAPIRTAFAGHFKMLGGGKKTHKWFEEDKR
jgi:hypothetical protein